MAKEVHIPGPVEYATLAQWAADLPNNAGGKMNADDFLKAVLVIAELNGFQKSDYMMSDLTAALLGFVAGKMGKTKEEPVITFTGAGGLT